MATLITPLTLQRGKTLQLHKGIQRTLGILVDTQLTIRMLRLELVMRLAALAVVEINPQTMMKVEAVALVEMLVKKKAARVMLMWGHQ
jgi:hypothetical protein